MTHVCPILEEDRVRMPRDDLEKMMERAAEAGARRALASVGLHDEQAAGDVRDLRSLLTSWRAARSEAWKTAIGVLTKGVLIAVLAGLAIKFGFPAVGGGK